MSGRAQRTNPRTYGRAPYRVAVVHGGPGAGGELAPVASELSAACGVLEPLQTAMSVDGQVAELAGVLERHAELPATLIGFSWGAWLALITAARHPASVGKLVLVGSGPFEERYAASILPTRLARLDDHERREAEALMASLNDASGPGDAFARVGALLAKADAFDPLPAANGDDVQSDPQIYRSVWPEASRLRASGRLLEIAADVRCPIVALHGDHDPHPAEGVSEPLARVARDFRFVLLSKCGHEPWSERNARDAFFKVLRGELETL